MIEAVFQKKLVAARMPHTDIEWSQDRAGVAFFGDFTEEQAMHHADHVLAPTPNLKAGLRRALRKGAVLFIERSIGNTFYADSKAMDVDWFAAPDVDLTLFEQEAMRLMVNGLQRTVIKVAEALRADGLDILHATSAARILVRRFETNRFAVEVYETPPRGEISVSEYEVDSLMAQIKAGRRRFLGLEVEVKACGVKLGDARLPVILAEDTRYGGAIFDLTRQAIEDTREFINGVRL